MADDNTSSNFTDREYVVLIEDGAAGAGAWMEVKRVRAKTREAAIQAVDPVDGRRYVAPTATAWQPLVPKTKTTTVVTFENG